MSCIYRPICRDRIVRMIAILHRCQVHFIPGVYVAFHCLEICSPVKFYKLVKTDCFVLWHRFRESCDDLRQNLKKHLPHNASN